MSCSLPIALFDSLFLEHIAHWLGPNWYGYQVGAILSVLLISTICGMIGALVVGNQMAFFSDAMAHCAFAGISLGVIIAFAMGFTARSEELAWILPLIMASFGALIGVGIAFVRERTGLASDTVIGVFFAGAIGFGAMILRRFPGGRHASIRSGSCSADRRWSSQLTFWSWRFCWSSPLCSWSGDTISSCWPVSIQPRPLPRHLGQPEQLHVHRGSGA